MVNAWLQIWRHENLSPLFKILFGAYFKKRSWTSSFRYIDEDGETMGNLTVIKNLLKEEWKECFPLDPVMTTFHRKFW